MRKIDIVLLNVTSWGNYVSSARKNVTKKFPKKEQQQQNENTLQWPRGLYVGLAERVCYPDPRGLNIWQSSYEKSSQIKVTVLRATNDKTFWNNWVTNKKHVLQARWGNKVVAAKVREAIKNCFINVVRSLKVRLTQ